MTVCSFLSRLLVTPTFFALFLAGTPTTTSFQLKAQPWRRSLHSSTLVDDKTTLVQPSRTKKTQLHVWTQAMAAIGEFYRAAPYAAGALTCGAKASAADYVAQKRQWNNKETFSKFETARNAAFLLYGALYQGVAQEFIYNHCYAAWFGSTNHPIVVLKKVLFDLLVQTTLVTLPVAYLTKAVIFRYSFREGLRRYKYDVIHNGLLTKYFALWGPVQCLTFSVVPEHLRISFIAAVSFFWLIILSTISGRVQVAPPFTKAVTGQHKREEMPALVNGGAIAQ